MKKIIYYGYPAFGHLNQTLVLVKELVRQGNEVLYYSNERYKKYITAAGVTFRDYGWGLQDQTISRNLGTLSRALLDIVEKKGSGLMRDAEKEKPDLIMHDGIAVWGKFIASKLQLPAVSLITTPVFHPKMAVVYPKLFWAMTLKALFGDSHSLQTIVRYHMLAKHYGASGNLSDIFVNKEKLNIVFTSSYFHPSSEVFDKSFLFAGPMLSERADNADVLQGLPKNKKIIYFSLGTVVNDNLELFRKCLDAFKGADYHVITSLGDRFDPKDLPSVPANVSVVKYVNQLKVLQKVDLFITHGGMNSTNEGLYYGVPLILLPDTHEQKAISLRVEELGAGIYLDKHKVTSEQLSEAVEKVLNNKQFKQKADKIGETLHEAGGAEKAVQAILRLLHS